MEIPESAALRKLEDSDLEIARRDEDVRGRKMVDRHGDEIGKVDALFIDESEQKIRFLRVSSGGFLGIGATKFLIPVDAITRIDDDHVHIDKTREHLVGAPPYEPELVDRREYYQSLYQYYGYPPYWTTGYAYPPFPYYPAPLAGRPF